MRYVVTEIEGRLEQHTSGRGGLSCHVIDTLWNRRIVATYRSEELQRGGLGGGAFTREGAMERARYAARVHAERLNGAALHD